MRRWVRLIGQGMWDGRPGSRLARSCLPPARSRRRGQRLRKKTETISDVRIIMVKLCSTDRFEGQQTARVTYVRDETIPPPLCPVSRRKSVHRSLSVLAIVYTK